MWNGSLGNIEVEKRRIKVLHLSTAHVPAESYRGGPTTRDFGKEEIYKTLGEKIIEVVRTE